QYRVEFGKQVLQGTVPHTGGWDKRQVATVGTVLIPKAGKYSLAIKPVEIRGEGLMALHAIWRRPAVGSRTIVAGNAWAFRFPAIDLRHLKFVVNEYRGEA